VKNIFLHEINTEDLSSLSESVPPFQNEETVFVQVTIISSKVTGPKNSSAV